MYEIFSDISPSNQTPGAAHVYSIYTVYLSVVTCAPPPIFIRGGPHALYVHMLLECREMIEIGYLIKMIPPRS